MARAARRRGTAVGLRKGGGVILAIDYASPSVFESDRERALLGIASDARRPVRFHGRLVRNVPLFRFVLRALGEAIWSNETWTADGDRLGWVLDPVITVHPDRLFFEAFSQDRSVYAMVVANPAMFATEGEIVTGTTNIDFTAWLWGALGELRSSRETWFRVGAHGVELKTTGAGGRFERKVDVPDDWVRGFLQVSGAMAMPGTRITARPADLLAAIRFLRYTKSKVSPRALRYEFNPGEPARIVLEPWEHIVPLRGAEHGYTERRTIRTWGRRRLKLIEPLLPFAESVDIHLKGRGLPSFYVVRLPDLTFVLGLSGWGGRDWADSGDFELLTGGSAADSTLIPGVRERLENALHATPAQLARDLGESPEAIWRACERLCRQGRVMFDAESREFRHRELFDQPIDEAKFFPPDDRLERARALVAQRAIPFARCEPQETRKTRQLRTPNGPVTREIVYRDWRVTGGVGSEKTELVVNDTGRILFGTCTCAHFQEHLLGRGPCEHMLALYLASADGRKDLPTSNPTTSPTGEPVGEEQKKTDEDFDADDADEKSEGR